MPRSFPHREWGRSIVRHAQKITLVLHGRGDERPAEPDVGILETLLKSEPLVTKAGPAGRLVIYSLERASDPWWLADRDAPCAPAVANDGAE